MAKTKERRPVFEIHELQLEKEFVEQFRIMSKCYGETFEDLLHIAVQHFFDSELCSHRWDNCDGVDCPWCNGSLPWVPKIRVPDKRDSEVRDG